MSDMTQSFDHLPHIDTEPTSQELAAASELIALEQSQDETSTLHPTVSTSFEPQFSSLINTAHESIAANGAARSDGTGIDLTRYEEPSAPDSPNANREAWQSALSQAYISHSYLSQRQLNLSLLERFGKNAWLISNDQVESELKAIEQELARTTSAAQQLSAERQRNQSRVQGELDGLQDTWRVGVGRAIETEIAVESLRREILDKRRHGA